MKKNIEAVLLNRLNEPIVDIIDESMQHAGHTGNPHYKSENTHLNIKIVSKTFDNMTRINRHRLVNEILQPYFKQELHALTLDLRTPGEME